MKSYFKKFLSVQTSSRYFSLYVKNRGSFTYEGYANKLRDYELEFPHGKRNKIILVARELDRLTKDKLSE